jgi:hypothetical protein
MSKVTEREMLELVKYWQDNACDEDYEVCQAIHRLIEGKKVSREFVEDLAMELSNTTEPRLFSEIFWKKKVEQIAVKLGHEVEKEKR